MKRHIHVARLPEDEGFPEGYPDRCRVCNKDIRDEIHLRVGEAAHKEETVGISDTGRGSIRPADDDSRCPKVGSLDGTRKEVLSIIAPLTYEQGLREGFDAGAQWEVCFINGDSITREEALALLIKDLTGESRITKVALSSNCSRTDDSPPKTYERGLADGMRKMAEAACKVRCLGCREGLSATLIGYSQNFPGREHFHMHHSGNFDGAICAASDIRHAAANLLDAEGKAGE